MRRLGGSTLSPVGTLSSSHSILALTPSRNPPVSACANYTCANQPTSNEADLSSSLQRGLNHSCPLRTEAGWSVDLLSVSTTILTLLNYAEALTNFRPPMLLQPFARPGKGIAVDWLQHPGNTISPKKWLC